MKEKPILKHETQRDFTDLKKTEMVLISGVGEKMAAESLEYESWSSCSVRTRKEQIRSMGGDKSNFREMKRRRMSRTSKKTKNFD